MELENESTLMDYDVKDWTILHFILIPKIPGPHTPFDDDDRDENTEQFWWLKIFEPFFRQICICDDAYEEVPLYRETETENTAVF